MPIIGAGLIAAVIVLLYVLVKSRKRAQPPFPNSSKAGRFFLWVAVWFLVACPLGFVGALVSHNSIDGILYEGTVASVSEPNLSDPDKSIYVVTMDGANEPFYLHASLGQSDTVEGLDGEEANLFCVRPSSGGRTPIIYPLQCNLVTDAEKADMLG